MFERTDFTSAIPETSPYVKLVRRLGETLVVRDVMVQPTSIRYVKPGDRTRANQLVEENRYSVVPVSEDGITFPSVFLTERQPGSDRRVIAERPTSISDYIPDSTPLAEAFFLFDSREWYFTLRNNRVSGLMTYWAFNSREFGVQLYVGLSRVEELARNALAEDGCGLTDESGLNLSSETLTKTQARKGTTWEENGGNRFVDELDFHEILDSLCQHAPWRTFLNKKYGKTVSDSGYKKLCSFTTLRNSVMHGRVLFPTYAKFRKYLPRIVNLGNVIVLLDEYRMLQGNG
jgi:hypothetical protein